MQVFACGCTEQAGQALSTPLRVMLRVAGLDVMTEEDRLYAEIGRRSVEAKRKNAEAKKARRLIQELEEKL